MSGGVALLVVDLQQTLCAGQWTVHDAAGVVDRVNALARRAREAGAPVIWVQHAEDEGPMSENSPGWRIAEGLEVRDDAGDLHVHKRGSDAFHRTPLSGLLRERGIERLVVTGAQSDFCVDSTVRRALALGHPVTLVADAISTLDNAVLSAPQITAHHLATLANMESYGPRATVANAADVTF